VASENSYKNRYAITRSITYARILVGPVLSGFAIYLVLSYLLVPSRITIPISIIMSILVFGLTKYYHDTEKKNDFAVDGKEEYQKSSVTKIIFVIAFVVCLIFSFSSGPSNDIFVPWNLLTASQLMKLVAAIALSTFLPGYAILNTLGLKHELRPLPKFLIAYLISVFVIGFTGYSLASIGLAISDSLIIFNCIYTSILILFVLRSITGKEFVKSFRYNSSSQEILKHNSSVILVFASLIAFVVMSTYYLYNGTIIGDQWYHHGRSAMFLSGAFRDFAISGIDELLYPPFTSAFLASFFALSNTPSANAYVAIDFLNVMPIFAFYYFFSKWLPNYKKAALLATTLFMLSSGFGWIYALNLTETNPITSSSTALEIFRDAGLKTFDVWVPNTFLNVGHPDITSPLIIFALPAGFVLLGLLKEDIRNNFKYFFIVVIVSIVGLISHDEFGLFIIVGSVIPIIFMLKGKNSIFAAFLSGLLVLFLISFFFPGEYYTKQKILGISLTSLLFLFVSFTGILYASKILFKLHKRVIGQDIFKKIFTRKILFICGVTLVSIFSYLYILSFIIWNFQVPYFDVRINTDSFGVVPWHFYPLRFGVTGLVGIAFLLSYFFKKFEKEVFVFGVIATIAFLIGPYYSDHRMNKYIMASFAGFASILLFKILSIQRPPIMKPVVIGIFLGFIIITSSFSTLMYLGYTALALENPNFYKFNEDLPRRHFPNDFGLLNFLHQNLNLKSDNISVPLNESRYNQGLNAELEGFVGVPPSRIVQSSALESSSLEGFYALLNQSNSRDIIFPQSFIDRGLSPTNQFALENFPMTYQDSNYTVLSVPILSPPNDDSDVTLVLKTKGDVRILSKEVLNYSSNIVNSSELTKTERNVTLYGTKTIWSQPIVNYSSNFIESKIKFIDQTALDNHAGIVWDDGKQNYYVYMRSDKLSISNSEGEIATVPIKRGHELWHSLKISFDLDFIDVYFDDELKIHTIIVPSSQVHFSKIGLRVYNSVVEFESITIGSEELINFDPKFNYEYPLNALALSKAKYNVLDDDDIDIFSKKTVFLAFDPIDINKYLEFVKNGGTLIVLNSDNNLNGGFSDFLHIQSGNEREFDSVLNDKGKLAKISGITRDLQINSGGTMIKSFYMKDNQRISPFAVEKEYENGKIVFVNTYGYFKSISNLSQQFFLALKEIPSLTDLNLQQSKNETGVSVIPISRFVGEFNAMGLIQINSSSMIISKSHGFYISTLPDEQGIFGSTQKNKTAIQVTGLQIIGPSTIVMNSTNLSSELNSEYGYMPFIFPRGFNMMIEISNKSGAQIFTDNNDNMIKIPDNKIQDNKIEIQSLSSTDPSLAPDLILMKNPTIYVNGITNFNELHSNDPSDLTKPWAGGVPIMINGTFTAKFSHLDVKPYNLEKSITYFKWLKVNGTTALSPKKPKNILEIPWSLVNNSALNTRLQTIIPATAILVILSFMWYDQKNKKGSTSQYFYPELKITSSLKMEEKQYEIGEEEIQIKISEQIPKEALQKGLEQIKIKVQDALATLNASSYQLENVKNEHGLELEKLAKSKEELESGKTEISKLRSERQSILEEIQSVRTDPVTIKLQSDQKELESIKEKIESLSNELLEINSEKNNLISELDEMQHEIESAKTEFNEINSKIKDEKSELNSLQFQQEVKTKEVVLAKKEIVFIEKELASVGKESDTKKIMEAAGALVASINTKYKSIKNELETIKTAYARLKTEYETVKNELESLKNKDK
jgi:hypothetical protein